METTAHADYFDQYTGMVSENDAAPAFEKQDAALEDFLNKVSVEKAGYAYAPGKWTLKEMLQHQIDCERIFCYRALCIARRDKTVLPGFEENDYAASSDANRRTWTDLAAEMRAQRASTKLMFASFTKQMNDTVGKFSSAQSNAGRLAFIIIGHTYHHIEVAEEKYLAN